MYSNYSQSNLPQNPQFNGLTAKMSRRVYNGFFSMKDIALATKNKMPIVGSLPKYMIHKIEGDKGTAIREIYKVFADVATELREFEPTANSNFNEIRKQRNDSTVEKAAQILRKHKILGKFDDFDIEYIDKGGKGSVYKLSGLKDVCSYDEDEYVIKVFHNNDIQQNDYHGCYPEVNIAAYWMKHIGTDTNRGKFFWADLKSAYMINKYIDEDVRLPKRVINPYSYGLKFTDEDPISTHNTCKGYSYDWGGGVLINEIKHSNNEARKIMLMFKHMPDKYRVNKWYQYFNQNYMNIDKNNKYAGLALSIKYIQNDDYKLKCLDDCLELSNPMVNRALGYLLKYIPHRHIPKYLEILAQKGDPELNIILKNELPLLSRITRENLSDDVVILNRKDYAQYTRFSQKHYDEYYQIAKKYKVI